MDIEKALDKADEPAGKEDSESEGEPEYDTEALANYTAQQAEQTRNIFSGEQLDLKRSSRTRTRNKSYRDYYQ